MRKVSSFFHQSLTELSLLTAENVRICCKFLDLYAFQMVFVAITVTAKGMKKYYLGKSYCIF